MAASDASRPLVSIGIPLYRARPFVDRIAWNIESIDYPNLEFLLADQHGLDDAVAELRERFADDPRVRLFETTDELDWLQNYNFVLRNATGKYFRLLAQDDIILPESIAVAANFMDENPGVVIVDGPVDVVDAAGVVVKPARDAPSPTRFQRRDALALMAGWRHESANLGLIRRAAVVDNNLFMPRTHGLTGLSVRAWLFALALRGSIGTVPGYRNQRCVHPDSFTSTFARLSIGGQVHRLASYLSACLRAWREAPVSAIERLWGPPVIVLAGFFALPALRGWQRLRR